MKIFKKIHRQYFEVQIKTKKKTEIPSEFFFCFCNALWWETYLCSNYLHFICARNNR